MRTVYVTLITALFSGQLAACPKAADLDGGIVVLSGHAAAHVTHSLRRLTPDLVWRSQSSRAFPDAWNSFRHAGLWSLFDQRESGSGAKVVRYDFDLPAADALTAGMEFGGAMSWGDPDGAQVWTANQTYSVVAADAISIGACTYDALKITTIGAITLPSGKVRSVNDTVVWLPELLLELGYSKAYEVRRAGFLERRKIDRMIAGWLDDSADAARIIALYGDK